MKCKTGLFLIGLIIVFLLINATKGPKREAREEHDENPLFPQNAATDTEQVQQKQHNEDPLKCSPSQAAVGEDVTLDFHFDPKPDVALRLIEWKFNTFTYVLVYTSQGFSEHVKHKQFKGRASLDNSGNIKEGKLPLKISKVTTDDAGIYSCTVRYKKGKETNFCSTVLIIDNPEENRNRGIQTDKKTEENNNNNNNNNRHHGFIALIIPLIAIVAFGIIMWKKHVNHNAGADWRGGHERVEMGEMAH